MLMVVVSGQGADAAEQFVLIEAKLQAALGPYAVKMLKQHFFNHGGQLGGLNGLVGQPFSSSCRL